MIDENYDPYPTDEQLEIIEKWDWNDIPGVFEYIKSLWFYDEYFSPVRDANSKKTIYMVSTVGWSGNESLIYALQKNYFIWSTTWVSSRRGGHYIFEVKDKTNE